MGDGFVVFPEDGQVYAPEDGQVMFVFPTKHAIGLKTADGLEYLLHIGVDTVKLDGNGFEVFVKDGDLIKRGDKLMEFDLQYIKEHAASEACMTIFTGLTRGQEIMVTAKDQISSPGTDRRIEINAKGGTSCLGGAALMLYETGVLKPYPI